MSRTRKLNDEQLEHFENLVKKGVAPEDIAKEFGIAISTVHAYKTRLKNKGIEFPNVRGQRPKGNTVNKTDQDGRPIMIKKLTAAGNKTFKIIFNGTRININSEALEVNITDEGVEVKTIHGD